MASLFFHICIISTSPDRDRRARYCVAFIALLLFFGPTAVKAYDIPLYCSYFPSHSRIVCDVNIEGLAVTDITLNDGQCAPPNRLRRNRPTSETLSDLESSETYRVPVDVDYRRKYEDGDSFYIVIDPDCYLRNYTVTANGKQLRFDVNPLAPFLKLY